jgi:hypothetical protein
MQTPAKRKTRRRERLRYLIALADFVVPKSQWGLFSLRDITLELL